MFLIEAMFHAHSMNIYLPSNYTHRNSLMVNVFLSFFETCYLAFLRRYIYDLTKIHINILRTFSLIIFSKSRIALCFV